ncbi:hypothetical protein C7999DRAFT_12414, partial [Corynascus novoguineensis]
SLENWETGLESTNKEQFLQLTATMLQRAPKDRKTWSELLNDPWMTRALLRLSSPMRPSKAASVATIQDEARLVSSDMRGHRLFKKKKWKPI